MEYHAAKKIIEFAKLWGAKADGANLWVKVLRYFATQTCAQLQNQTPQQRHAVWATNENAVHLQNVLRVIEADELLPPLMVVQLLSAEEYELLPIGVVRDYLVRYFEQLNEQTANDEQTIDNYKQETELVRAKTTQNECLITGNKSSRVSEMVDALAVKAAPEHLHESFAKRLSDASFGLGSQARFGVVAEHFGYGVFDSISGGGGGGSGGGGGGSGGKVGGDGVAAGGAAGASASSSSVIIDDDY